LKKSFKLWKLNNIKPWNNCNSSKISFSITCCFTNNLENKVLLLTRCMLLFQITDYIFKLHVVLSLDPFFYNFNSTLEMNTKFFLTIIVLHHLQLCNSLLVLSQDLGPWVKLKSTTWFFQFLLIKYDDEKWVENFRMIETTLFNIINQLWPLFLK
jgi:hypothetical protein